MCATVLTPTCSTKRPPSWSQRRCARFRCTSTARVRSTHRVERFARNGPGAVETEKHSIRERCGAPTAYQYRVWIAVARVQRHPSFSSPEKTIAAEHTGVRQIQVGGKCAVSGQDGIRKVLVHDRGNPAQGGPDELREARSSIPQGCRRGAGRFTARDLRTVEEPVPASVEVLASTGVLELNSSWHGVLEDGR